MMGPNPPAPGAAALAQPNPPIPPQIQEFSIRLPKNNKKKHSIMRFNGVLNVDFKEWKNVKMKRENNMKDFRGADEDMPKFGAGSEFGKDAREEARRRRFGINSKKYKPEDQSWILKANGKTEKKFKSIREGGIGENAAYYVFTHAADGSIDAFPLREWHNFKPIQRYKALTADEAEMEFSRRNKVMNFFSLMLRKRLRNDEEDVEDGESLEDKKGKKSNKKEKDFKISEMDEWMDSDDDDDSDSDEKEANKESDDEDDKKKKKKDAAKKKKKKNASHDEAFEDSDDGDEEGRECDYISDSSASESELESQKEIKSVAEEDALRKLLGSDEEDEDEEEKEKEKEDDADQPDEADGGEDDKDKDKPGKSNDKKSNDNNSKDKKSKDKNDKKGKKKEATDSSINAKSGLDRKSASTESSRSTTPTMAHAGPSNSLKRPLSSSPDPSTAKKIKLESKYMPFSHISGSSESGITESTVRRYLMRKPMTLKMLCKMFKSKKTGLSSDQMSIMIGSILKNMNPKSRTINGEKYYEIKPERQ